MKLTTFMHPVVICTYDSNTGKTEFMFDWYNDDGFDLVLDEINEEIWFGELGQDLQNSINDASTEAIAMFVDENPDYHDKDTVTWAESYMHKIRPFDQLVPVVFGSDSDDTERFWA